MNLSTPLFWTCAVVAFSVMNGCRPQPPVESPNSVHAPSAAGPAVAEPDAAMSPVACTMMLGDLHRRRDYDGLAGFILEDQRESTLSFLRAVDGVLDANSRLRGSAIERYGRVLADSWDLSAIQNNLGVFSTDTRILGQRFRGERAEVTLQEGEQVPLVRAQFRRVNRIWLLVPEPIPTAIAPELTRLGREIDALADRVEAGADYLEYLKAFPEKIAPLIARVMSADDAGRTAAVEADAESP
jgi:hypothetical protein